MPSQSKAIPLNEKVNPGKERLTEAAAVNLLQLFCAWASNANSGTNAVCHLYWLARVQEETGAELPSPVLHMPQKMSTSQKQFIVKPYIAVNHVPTLLVMPSYFSCPSCAIQTSWQAAGQSFN